MMRSILRLLRFAVPSAGVLRVGAYGICVFLVLALLGARRLYADAREAALAAGHEIARLSDLTGTPETVLVNGARLHHSSVYTSESTTTVLDRFEAYCKDGALFESRSRQSAQAVREQVRRGANSLLAPLGRSRASSRRTRARAWSPASWTTARTAAVVL